MLERHSKFTDIRNIILILLLWVVLRPSPAKLLNMPTDRIMDLFQTGLLFFLWIIILPVCRFRVDFILKLFFLMFVSQMVSFFWGTVVLGYKFGIRDFYEFYRFPYFYLVYGLIYQINIQENSLKKYVLNSIMLCFVIEYVFVILYFSNIFGFREFSSLIYFVKTSKLQGTFQNDNWFGAFLTFGYSFMMSKILYRENLIISIILLLITVTALLYTQSRTAVITLVFLTIYLFLLYSVSNRFRFKAKNVIPAVMITIAISFFAAKHIHRFPEYDLTIKGYYAGEVTEVRGIKERLDESISLAKHTWAESPIFGFGPSKYSITDMIHNNYVKWFLRYGIIGTFLYLLFFFHLFYNNYKMTIRSNNLQLKIFGSFFQGNIFALLVSMLAGDFFEVPQIATFFLILCAISERLRHDVKQNSLKGRNTL